MRRFSFRVANEDEELFGDQNGGREKLQSSRASFEIVPSFLSSSSKRRRSICRNVSSVSTALSIVSIRKSFSYDKLAQAPIHLTVIKLDGSSFGINFSLFLFFFFFFFLKTVDPLLKVREEMMLITAILVMFTNS